MVVLTMIKPKFSLVALSVVLDIRQTSFFCHASKHVFVARVSLEQFSSIEGRSLVTE
jgi:hypothetical protein